MPYRKYLPVVMKSPRGNTHPLRLLNRDYLDPDRGNREMAFQS